MNDNTATRLSQYVKIQKSDNTEYFFKFPDKNSKGQLKNNGNGTMDFEVAGSGVRHFSADATVGIDQAGCCLTVGAATPIILTLPPVSEASGQRFGFTRTQDVSSTVTIETQNSETLSIVDYVNGPISGTSISSDNSQPVGSTVRLYSTGTEWVGCNLSNGWSA